MVLSSRDRAAKPSTPWADTSGLSRIIGFTCVAGFGADIVVAAMPVAIKSEQWRMSLLQQMGDRGIILLFGLALLSLGYAGKRLWSKRIGLASLVIGVFFLLSCLSFVRDSLLLQEFATNNINSQISELQERIEEQGNSPELAGQVTPEQIQEATRQINLEAASYRQTVRNSTVRVGLSALSNLLITGIAFVSLGRYCMQGRRRA